MHPNHTDFAPYIEKGLVTARKSGDLTVYNYTQECQFSGAWDEVTRQARGLILDEDGNVVARSWAKFFNFGEAHAEEPPDRLPDEITDKMDGSLGIGFRYKGEDRWATRGSLESPQAALAAQIWQSVPRPPIEEDLTLLVEIVGPDNPVVVTYAVNDLVLLGARRTSDGYDYSRGEVLSLAAFYGLKPVSAHMLRDSNALADLANSHGPEKEGYVARWGDLRLKFKGDSYRRVARLLQRLSSQNAVEEMWRENERALPDVVPPIRRAQIEAEWAKLDQLEAELLSEARELGRRYPTPREMGINAQSERAFPLAIRMVRGLEVDSKTLTWKKWRRDRESG